MNYIFLDTWMNNRIFDLDLQLIADACIMALSIFTLFFFMSNLLFNPARELLRKRQQKIKEELEAAARDQMTASQYKADYEGKLKKADKKAEELLSIARKDALKKENEIISEAKGEAVRIINRANKDIELEKAKVQDEVKQGMISVASVMAGKIIKSSIDESEQNKLFEETLKEMGDGTWQN